MARQVIPDPSRAPVSFAAATVTAPDRGWDLLLVCVAGYIATAVGRIHQLLPTFVAAVLAIGVYIVHQTGPRRIERLRAPTTTYVMALLLWVALSVPGALYPGLAFDLLTGIFIKTVVLYLLIVGSVRGFRDVERLAFAYFAVTALYAAIVLTRFKLGSGDDWRLGSLYYYDTNDFATYAVTAMPIGVYFAFGRHPLAQRLVSALSLALLSISFINSGSRGGFLAIVAVALYILLGYKTIPARWRILGTAVIAAIFVATASDRYWSQMRTIVIGDEDYNRTSETGRWHIWRRGIGYMLQHPVLGVGAYNFQFAEGTISPLAKRQAYGIGVRWNAAHNSFIQIGAELGLPGLFFFVAVIATAFAALRSVVRSHPGEPVKSRGPPQLGQALTGSLIGFVVGAFFLSLAYHEMAYAVLGLAVALRKVTLGPRPTRFSTAVRRPIW
ncbi:MAG: O-antigen ligase family protein [Bacillati bacterium ANGP1]|uniref:O-antigen ligase family protein n=1 Tax=Candidatus Segetimicrobium genomatis TaxID=2569760 RepID=A0A537L4W7_9BACT|nr:MAG: O-antigen ligase family protein [Terrabacteria group bacterium ANGP1]